ncbi:MAG TPA: lamin tail domain-containing protein [Candidatus Bipolaricaulota bacterium]
MAHKSAPLIFWASLMLWGAVSTLAAQPGDVVINEVAWMGTAASTNDEWIEIFNTTHEPIDLAGWTLIAADGSPSITLVGTIPANGFFLLERTDETTVSDVAADQLFSGSLSNTGEAFALKDTLATVIDTANGNGGAWPAGNATTRRTMERVDTGAPDSDANWASNNSAVVNGLDASGAPLSGTPTARNSVATGAGPETVFVSSNGSDLDDGLTSSTPFATIQRGIHILPPGGKVTVLGDLFHENAVITKSMTLEAASASTLMGGGGAAITVNAGHVTISGFSIESSAQGIAIAPGATNVNIARNALVGNAIGILNNDLNTVNAKNNWWGCNAGPNQPGCDLTSGAVDASAWLIATLEVVPQRLEAFEVATLTLGLNHDNEGANVSNVLARPFSIETSRGESPETATALPLPLLSPSRGLGIGIWVFLTMGFILAARMSPRRIAGLALVLVIAVGIGGCGLFFNQGTTPGLSQTFVGTLNQGVITIEISSPLPGLVRVNATIDAQALTTDVLFASSPL